MLKCDASQVKVSPRPIWPYPGPFLGRLAPAVSFGFVLLLLLPLMFPLGDLVKVHETNEAYGSAYWYLVPSNLGVPQCVP